MYFFLSLSFLLSLSLFYVLTNTVLQLPSATESPLQVINK